MEQDTTDDLEKQCVTYALGFVEDFRTHRLTGPSGGKPFALSPSESGSENPSAGDIHQINPFWIVAADKEVLDGHGGIWQRPFLLFLASILFQHFDGVSKRLADDSPAAARAQIAPGTSGNVAAFAQTLEGLFPVQGQVSD